MMIPVLSIYAIDSSGQKLHLHAQMMPSRKYSQSQLNFIEGQLRLTCT